MTQSWAIQMLMPSSTVGEFAAANLLLLELLAQTMHLG